MADKRIYSLTTASDLTGSYIPLDKSGNAEALKIGAEGIDFYTKVEVSSAEILALNTAPKLVVVAQGVGKILIPTRSIVKYTYGSIDYATNIGLRIDWGLALTAYALIGFSNTMLGGSVDKTGIAIFNDGTNIAAASTVMDNKGLYITVPNGDPTAGDGTLTVHLWYKVITL